MLQDAGRYHVGKLQSFFSLSDWMLIRASLVIGIASSSLGVVLSSFFGFPILVPAGIGVLAFFLILFAGDAKLFLLFLIPFRMVLDFFGDTLSFRIADHLELSLSQAIGLAICAVGIVFFFRRGVFLKSMRALMPFVVLLVWGALSLLVSMNISETLRDILRIFDIFALASMAFILTESQRDTKRILISILISALIPLAFGWWQLLSGHGYPEEFVRIERIYGTFGHPNVFGMFLFSIVVSSLIFFRLFAETARERVFALCIAIASLLTMLPTLARVAWVITFFFFSTFAIFRFRKLILPIISISFLTILLVNPVRDRIYEAVTPSADSSVLWRVNIWGDAYAQTLSGGRVIFGSGLNTFSTLIGALHSESFGSAEAHNDFVKFFAEGGVIGLSVYLFWLGWFFFHLFRIYRSSESSMTCRGFSFLMLLFLASLVAASFSDAVFKSTPIQWVFWILVGTILGLEKGMSLPAISKRVSA